MKWALVDGGNVVVNIIEYHKESGFRAPDGQTLRQVNDWADLGEDANAPEPA